MSEIEDSGPWSLGAIPSTVSNACSVPRSATPSRGVKPRAPAPSTHRKSPCRLEAGVSVPDIRGDPAGDPGLPGGEEAPWSRLGLGDDLSSLLRIPGVQGVDVELELVEYGEGELPIPLRHGHGG